jgi:2-keto-3-deoxy-6-phosphogluconate aldolase
MPCACHPRRRHPRSHRRGTRRALVASGVGLIVLNLRTDRARSMVSITALVLDPLPGAGTASAEGTRELKFFSAGAAGSPTHLSAIGAPIRRTTSGISAGDRSDYFALSVRLLRRLPGRGSYQG